MKLLVLSDSHGHDEKLTDIILEHPEADQICASVDSAYQQLNEALDYMAEA